MAQSTAAVFVAAEAAHDFVRRLLRANDVPDGDAAVIAACLVRADLRGVETHGVTRLPGYLDRVRRGLINPRPSLAPRRVTPVAALLDGQNAFGFVVATRAMQEAMTLAAELGVGIAGVTRSTHFGMAACYVLQALEAGFVSLVFTNASRGMPPWGGREALLGTSPLAAGAPGGRAGGFVLDMSTAVAARGKIRVALRRGEQIPVGWALDKDGGPTTNAAAALNGVMLPVGGPKGYGLSMLMDIFGGVLTGAAFGGDVGDQYKDYDRPQNVGHFFVAMRPDLFVDRATYEDRMDVLITRIHDSPKARGFEEILVPGEPEARQERTRRSSGIPYAPEDLGPLNEEASRVGIAALRHSPVPLVGTST